MPNMPMMVKMDWNGGLADGEATILMGIAIIAGGFVINYFGFKTLFIIMGLVQIISTIYQAQILKK